MPQVIKIAVNLNCTAMTLNAELAKWHAAIIWLFSPVLFLPWHFKMSSLNLSYSDMAAQAMAYTWQILAKVSCDSWQKLMTKWTLIPVLWDKTTWERNILAVWEFLLNSWKPLLCARAEADLRSESKAKTSSTWDRPTCKVFSLKYNNI